MIGERKHWSSNWSSPWWWNKLSRQFDDRVQSDLHIECDSLLTCSMACSIFIILMGFDARHPANKVLDSSARNDEVWLVVVRRMLELFDDNIIRAPFVC
jgi:hypothetical protein